MKIYSQPHVDASKMFFVIEEILSGQSLDLSTWKVGNIIWCSEDRYWNLHTQTYINGSVINNYVKIKPLPIGTLLEVTE